VGACSGCTSRRCDPRCRAAAFFLGPPIIDSISGDTVGRRPPVLPGVFVMLASLRLSSAMVFLVLAEALVPSGTLLGPLYLVGLPAGWPGARTADRPHHRAPCLGPTCGRAELRDV